MLVAIIKITSNNLLEAMKKAFRLLNIRRKAFLVLSHMPRSKLPLQNSGNG